MIFDVDSTTVAALSVVAVAFVFGVLAAPYGLALELPPVTVALAVFAGTAGFACVMVPMVMDLVPDAAGRRARWALMVAPRVARIWRLAGRIPLLDQLFPQFASRLIRNGATIGGNLGTGSPIGDTPPALLALDAELILASSRGERQVPLAEYFTGYRQTVKAPDELIRTIVIPLPLAPMSAFHKIAKRRFDDISSVAIGYAVDVADGIVRDARIGLGGVAATPLRARATEAALIGRPWTEETVRTVAAVMAAEGTPMDDHRASSSYRSAMLGQSLLRFYFQGVGA